MPHQASVRGQADGFAGCWDTFGVHLSSHRVWRAHVLQLESCLPGASEERAIGLQEGTHEDTSLCGRRPSAVNILPCLLQVPTELFDTCLTCTSNTQIQAIIWPVDTLTPGYHFVSNMRVFVLLLSARRPRYAHARCSCCSSVGNTPGSSWRCKHRSPVECHQCMRMSQQMADGDMHTLQ